MIGIRLFYSELTPKIKVGRFWCRRMEATDSRVNERRRVSVIEGMFESLWVWSIALIVGLLQVGCDSNEPVGRLLNEQAAEAASIEASELDQALLNSAREVLLEEISMEGLEVVLGKGLWNSNRTAVAISIPMPPSKASLSFIFLYQPDGTFLACDASGVEGGNFGKLGTAGRESYDRYETTPVKWLHRDNGYFQVMMQTRAWKNGQRYTVAEPLVIRKDGFVVYR